MNTLIASSGRGKQNFDSSDLRSLLARGEPVTLLDVREPAEFAAGRIPGSRSAPLREFERHLDGLDPLKPVICVCASGRRSAIAAERLKARGFANVRQLAGGLDEWRQAELPLDRDARAPWSLERQVRVAAGALVLVGVGLGVAVHPLFLGLPAFVGAGLVFAAVTDWCGMGLLLARMPWNRRALPPCAS